MVQKCVVYKKIRKWHINLFFARLYITSQSFPISFDLAVFYPPEVKFHVFGTKHGEEKSLSNTFLLYLSVHCGDFIEQIKKSVIYTLT